MVDAEFRPGSDFQRVAARLRGAPAEIRKDLNRAVKDATAPAEAALKAAVLGLATKGTAGGGGRARVEHARSRSRSGRVSTKARGLRANVARGVQRKITYNGYRTGVRIRVDTARLPDDQRKLPKLMDKGKWRHPAGLGRNRGSVWVEQQVTPKGWFTDTMKGYKGPITRAIDEAARRAMERLQ